MGGESDLVGNLRDVHLVVQKKVGRLLQSDRFDEVARRYVHKLLQLAVQMDAAHSDLVAEHLDTEVGVLHICSYGLYYLVYQLVA